MRDYTLDNNIYTIRNRKFKTYQYGCFVSECIKNGYTHEDLELNNLFSLIENKKYKHLIDVGSNIGLYNILLNNFFNKISGFDININQTNLNNENLILNDITNTNLYNIGLANKKGVGEYSNKTIWEENFKFTDNGNILIDTIDNIFKDDFYDFIKIDVEGHESEVLLGAVETLKKYKPSICVEIHDQENYKICFEIFDSLNYTLISKIGANTYFLEIK